MKLPFQRPILSGISLILLLQSARSHLPRLSLPRRQCSLQSEKVRSQCRLVEALVGAGWAPALHSDRPGWTGPALV